ncbi:lysine--tRNA ligase [Candidatus Tachikawaea gelatinosa]|uniref:Lysine--tRNA ligase n=1 Tax=Candidatus Tachikawaea gelatinosa TaxID=1410383 RepID=A0A090ASC8_9ENTR|nr:lysine--tRNA ligase [Candidatus Tachikawaea gelatinosa]BAP58780.1 lysine--tRNA ligase [Candidatus Tachikawaea gelatinosa]
MLNKNLQKDREKLHISEEKEKEIRRKKLKNLRNSNDEIFPNDFRKNCIVSKLKKKYQNEDNQKLLNINVSIAGRIISKRIMGKASFAHIQDEGGKIQLYITCNSVNNNFYESFKKWDLGDIIGAKGYLFKTKKGELSVHCLEIFQLTKALRPLPDKYHGLVDKEICYRKRYLDLIVNTKSREKFKIRSKIFHYIRQFMSENNFLEVETPILQTIPGGASARPFITYHNSLNMDMYLRISPELYLKRLIVGGFERVFEINKSFRNEGLSTFHNPEFTMLELYIAYADYKDLMSFIENFFYQLTMNVLKKTIVKYGTETFDFSQKFIRMTMNEAIIKYNTKIKNINLDNFIEISNFATSIGISIERDWTVGNVIYEIFEKTVEKKLIQPTFITEYPIEVSPLAKRNTKKKSITDRFELFIGGYEVGNGFSELNDAEDQKDRFKKQISTKEFNSINEHFFYDKDYIIALEHGLPPTAGLGIGIDRLVMLLTNSQSIRDVILFPICRPDNK